MKVPLLDLKAQYAAIKEPVREAIDEVCDSQYFVLGPKVVHLEERIAEYSQAGYGIGVSSGTDALLVALMALDVGPESAVLTTPYTFFATAGTISRLGARPVFCDIDPETYNIDPRSVEATIERECQMTDDGLIHTESGTRVTVLMPVHLYGQTADMDGLMEIARKYDLRVVV